MMQTRVVSTLHTTMRSAAVSISWTPRTPVARGLHVKREE